MLMQYNMYRSVDEFVLFLKLNELLVVLDALTACAVKRIEFLIDFYKTEPKGRFYTFSNTGPG